MAGNFKRVNDIFAVFLNVESLWFYKLHLGMAFCLNK